MSTPFVTLSPQELWSISPDLRQKVHEVVTPKWAPPDTKKANLIEETQPQISDDLPFPDSSSFTIPLPGSLIIPDPYESYLTSLHPGEDPHMLTVTKESHSLCNIPVLVNNQETIECIIDPGCQIIAMSEAVAHDLSLIYDPSICLNMQSTNGEIDLSLRLAWNVPCSIGGITLYLQIHVIHDPAYNILLGWPFDVLTHNTVQNYANEDQTIMIHDLNSSRQATILTGPQRPAHCTHRAPVHTPDFRTSMNWAIREKSHWLSLTTPTILQLILNHIPMSYHPTFLFPMFTSPLVIMTTLWPKTITPRLNQIPIPPFHNPQPLNPILRKFADPIQNNFEAFSPYKRRRSINPSHRKFTLSRQPFPPISESNAILLEILSLTYLPLTPILLPFAQLDATLKNIKTLSIMCTLMDSCTPPNKTSCTTSCVNKNLASLGMIPNADDFELTSFLQLNSPPYHTSHGLRKTSPFRLASTMKYALLSKGNLMLEFMSNPIHHIVPGGFVF